MVLVQMIHIKRQTTFPIDRLLPNSRLQAVKSLLAKDHILDDCDIEEPVIENDFDRIPERKEVATA
jgi:hypothetical protein